MYVNVGMCELYIVHVWAPQSSFDLSISFYCECVWVDVFFILFQMKCNVCSKCACNTVYAHIRSYSIQPLWQNENLYAFNCKNMLDFGGTSRQKTVCALYTLHKVMKWMLKTQRSIFCRKRIQPEISNVLAYFSCLMRKHPKELHMVKRTFYVNIFGNHTYACVWERECVWQN